MRYLRYAFLGALAVILITMALANRGAVTLRVLPEEMANLLGWSFAITLPLFIVIFFGIAFGILIGFIWEWFREHRHRADAAAHRRERDRLARDADRRNRPATTQKDDVLALLEDGSRAR